jgi:antitoxin VapB
MNIKDPETERLAAEVAELTGTSKTAAVREALRQQRDRLAALEDVDRREARLQRFLEEEIWPLIPPDQLGKPITQEAQDEILGYGPHGV